MICKRFRQPWRTQTVVLVRVRRTLFIARWGADYADRIIAPTIQESVKASVAKFNAEEPNNEKELLRKLSINRSLANTLTARNIVVGRVFITDFKFSQAFASQVESKVVAFQKYLTEQNNLESYTGNSKPNSCSGSGNSKSKCSQSEWRISGYQDNYCTIKRVRRIFSGYQLTGGTDKCLMLLVAAQFLFSNYH